MNDDQANLLINAVQGHGDNLSDSLYLLGQFLKRLQDDQQRFLADLQAASEKAQTRANRAAFWSAVAAGAAALAAAVQAYAAVRPLIRPSGSAQVICSASPVAPRKIGLHANH